ncbi:MAG: hypothetical protein E2598_11920 [Sphingobium sp.]|nr:hypothetical protein [Sphingobium sp.]
MGRDGTAEDMLAGLVAQAEGDGGDLVMIRAIIEEASEMGAARALERLGLSDHAAAADMQQLRELLRAWRDAKGTLRDAIIGWLVRGVLALVLIGLAVKLGMLDMVRQ